MYMFESWIPSRIVTGKWRGCTPMMWRCSATGASSRRSPCWLCGARSPSTGSRSSGWRPAAGSSSPTGWTRCYATPATKVVDVPAADGHVEWTRRASGEGVLVCIEELRQRDRLAAGDASDGVRDVVVLVVWWAGTKVSPKLHQVFDRGVVDPGAGDVLEPLLVADLPVGHRPAEQLAERVYHFLVRDDGSDQRQHSAVGHRRSGQHR